MLSLHGPSPPPRPIWEESRPHAPSYRFHRVVGYTLLGGSVLQSTLGFFTFAAYERGQSPPPGLRTTHRWLGYSLIGLAATQSLIGTWNLLSLSPEKRQGKHLLHAVLSWGATLAYGVAGYLAWRARTDPDFGKYKSHRALAITATASTLLTIGTMIW